MGRGESEEDDSIDRRDLDMEKKKSTSSSGVPKPKAYPKKGKKRQGIGEVLFNKHTKNQVILKEK